MFGYFEGFSVGPDLEKIVKKHKKAYKSHRTMSDDEAALLHTCSDGYTPK